MKRKYDEVAKGEVLNPANVVNNRQHMPMEKINPDEIFKKIDDLKTGFGIEPSFLEQLFLPGARNYAQEIARAKSAVVHARKELIDGLSGAINIYVDAHAADLKLRTKEFILETFQRIFLTISNTNEDIIIGFFEIYSQFVDRIQPIPNLSAEMVEKAIRRAGERALDREQKSISTLNQSLDALTDQVIKLMAEIGVRRS
jgi:hypothetical protein